MDRKKIINVAIIAHVDAGKSTLVNALLKQSGVFRENQEIIDCIMDSNDLERERGITIYSKNCSIEYQGIKINIVDTPGHSDFSSEVERVIRTIDTAILLVDSSEGPMPQTRFVLQKSLELGLRPILFINKLDKKQERAKEVEDMVLDLFIDLGATDEQLEFPVLYGIATEGIARDSLNDRSNDLSPLFQAILEKTPPYPEYHDLPLQMQISDLAYDPYLGRMGIGRIYRGILKENQRVSISRRDGSIIKGTVSRVFVHQGLERIQVETAQSGDIAIIVGIEDISIGEVIGDEDRVEPMKMIPIEEPTIAMHFTINDSPFSGRSGEYLTSRHLKARLERELQVNVGLRVEELADGKGCKVSGRGLLHLSILLENMRREGYELSVSRPQVLMREEDSRLLEPVEQVTITTPEAYTGQIISLLNERKGVMENMVSLNGISTIEYLVPTRGLLGFRTEFINFTRGEGTLVHAFKEYQEYRGPMPSRTNGVLVSQNQGTTTAYTLDLLSKRATIIIPPGTEVYEGMIIGINSRSEDMTVNPCKGKKLTNVRAAGSDHAVTLSPPKIFNLEESLEFIAHDELVEITPSTIRLRKMYLHKHDRSRAEKRKENKREV